MAHHRNMAGIIPPYMLTDIVGRNPLKWQFARTLYRTSRMYAEHIDPLALADGTGRIEVYDCQNKTDRPGFKARFEGEGPCGIVDADKAYDFTVWVRNYHRAVHARNSIDDKGMLMLSSVNYDVGYNNAYWDGAQMTYGNGDGELFASFVLLDVCGHEIGHGVTEFDAGIEYYGQSGALNEHLSDVDGELIEQFSQNMPVNKADWVIGNGIFMPGVNGVGIRHMLRPGTAYNDPRLGADPQPDRMSKYKKTSSDNGGVHYNSGIPNRAFALFAIDVGGFAWEKAGKIWYAARKKAGSKPSFASFAANTIDVCQSMYPTELKKLQDAWAAVEVVPKAGALDTDTPVMPAGSVII